MGPMFPRLHVNDTEKGGPKAPPRNKMALYEQLSIPSQRFNNGVLPLNPNNVANMVTSLSSSQGSGLERGIFSQNNQSRPTHPTDIVGCSDFNTTLAQLEQKKRLEEDDFMVPTFVQSEIGQHHRKDSNGIGRENFCTSSPVYLSQSTNIKTAYDKEPKQRTSIMDLSLRQESRSQNKENPKGFVAFGDKSATYVKGSLAKEKIEGPLKQTNTFAVQERRHRLSNNFEELQSTSARLRQEGRNQNEENPKEFVAFGDKSTTYVKGSPAKEKIEGPLKQTDTFALQERRHGLANSCEELQSIGARLHHESRARSRLHNSTCGNGVSNGPVKGIIENQHDSSPRTDYGSEKLGSHKNNTNDGGNHEDKICRSVSSLQTQNWDRNDDASETSMVDSISGLDISPDDVVGIIGQKHFWKARRAIVNQQKVFAVQLFELHRLIKVQRLIAGSPNLLLEDSAYMGSPLKVTPTKNLPLEYIVKPSPHLLKHKDDSKNPNHKHECSAENAVGKTSLSSVQNVSQPSNYSPFSGKPLSAPVITDAQYNPCFHQPPGHQWLVPVMSPSEGLIYKPYPGHGFLGPVGPVCGGCGPPGSNPMMGGFINPGYGVPASHHPYPGIGVPPVGHSYFPPYGMPVFNPLIAGLSGEQANSFSGLGQPGQLLGGGVNFNVQQQSSCNLPPTQKHASIPKQQNSSNLPTEKKGRLVPNVVKPQVGSKENEMQGSTASSPGERAPGFGVVGPATEGRNPLPLFPISPEGDSQLHDADQPARVIKVVPHNARSATESAARIFQSIQDERKQYDQD
ncbi:Protein EARLY FLOWERING [Sarracenia purpurea var. burkii]